MVAGEILRWNVAGRQVAYNYMDSIFDEVITEFFFNDEPNPLDILTSAVTSSTMQRDLNNRMERSKNKLFSGALEMYKNKMQWNLDFLATNGNSIQQWLTKQ